MKIFSDIKFKGKIANIAQKHQLKLIIAFGSAVSGNRHSNSDLDIAILSDKSNLSFNEISNVLLDIQNIISGTEVDIVHLNYADPLLLNQVIENSKLLYGNNRDFLEFKIYAYKRYIDYKPYLEQERKFASKYVSKLNKATG